MSEQAHNYEVIEDTGFWNEAENQRLAEQKAHTLLQSWRGRLNPDQNGDVPLERGYSLVDDGQVELNSPTASTVHITHTSVTGEVIGYGFTFMGERGSLEVTGLPKGSDPASVLEAYDQFSRILFDCDRVELRQHS